MIHNSIIEDVEKFVSELFEERKENHYSYHNLQHTLSVVKHAKIIGENCGFTELEMNILLVSAWFHDTGYLFSPLNHEEKSKLIANDFLKKHHIAIKTIHKVLGCIEATKFPQRPKEKIAEALCDADFSHFAEPDFFEKSLRLKNELNELYNKNMNLKTYWEVTSELFQIHSYFTTYGKNILNKSKEINYQILKQKIEDEKLSMPR